MEASNCDVSDYHSPDNEIHTHTHTTEKVKSNAFVLFVRMYSLLPYVCVLPPQPSSTSDHICPSATPIEHSENGRCAIYLNFANLLTFFVWPASS